MTIMICTVVGSCVALQLHHQNTGWLWRFGATVYVLQIVAGETEKIMLLEMESVEQQLNILNKGSFACLSGHYGILTWQKADHSQSVSPWRVVKL